jgi:protein-S-isoprenylcysteine O-methyltransferase Ste14
MRHASNGRGCVLGDIDMHRFTTLVYGVVSYAIFFATFLYLQGFVAGVGVPKTIDSGPVGPLGAALLVDTLLLALFGVQHSLMARPGFKAWWTRFVPRSIERSTYVLASSAVLILLFVAWRPIPAAVWTVESPIASAALRALFVAGVGLVLLSTFLIDHFDLFGLRQVVLAFRRKAYAEKRFAQPFLYRFVRHPLYVGWIVTFWATPVMSAGHFLFALVMTSYILVAIPMEEPLGEPYRRWRERTPLFVPRVRPVGVEPAHAVGKAGEGAISAPAQ